MHQIIFDYSQKSSGCEHISTISCTNFGYRNHDARVETMARPLRGRNAFMSVRNCTIYFQKLYQHEMFISGKRANEISPLGVFRKHVEADDEDLLVAGNHTECETIETLEKAAADYRKKMHIDEEIF